MWYSWTSLLNLNIDVLIIENFKIIFRIKSLIHFILLYSIVFISCVLSHRMSNTKKYEKEKKKSCSSNNKELTSVNIRQTAVLCHLDLSFNRCDFRRGWIYVRRCRVVTQRPSRKIEEIPCRFFARLRPFAPLAWATEAPGGLSLGFSPLCSPILIRVNATSIRFFGWSE